MNKNRTPANEQAVETFPTFKQRQFVILFELVRKQDIENMVDDLWLPKP